MKDNTVIIKDQSTCFIIIRKEFNVTVRRRGEILTLYPSTSPELRDRNNVDSQSKFDSNFAKHS